MTDDEFFSGYSLAQILPGVNSTNMAVYIGQHLRGAIGSTTALLGLLTGPFVIVIAAAAVYHHLVVLPGFPAIMAGVAAAAVGMVFRMGMTSARGGYAISPRSSCWSRPSSPSASCNGRCCRSCGAGAAQHRVVLATRSPPEKSGDA